MAHKFRVGDEVWVKGSQEWVWEAGTVEVVNSSDKEYVVLTQSSRRVMTTLVLPKNPNPEGGYPDMTSMRYINEATILSNLHRRSIYNKPYTFMGPVLVAVNPVKRIKETIEVGSPKVTQESHPFAVAEVAYQQVKFGIAQRRRIEKNGGKLEDMEVPIAQTVILSGESGAGKTESSKMVLRHLVKRCGGGELDKRLLGSNPILEAFGNAATLRNGNSSRFGKLLKLHFDDDGKTIIGASTSTYLLERSRVTTHEEGERGYHIFYQLLAALEKDASLGLKANGRDKVSTYGLSPGASKSYRYLAPKVKKTMTLGQVKGKPAISPKDAKRFIDTRKAMSDIGMNDEVIDSIFRIVAAVLLLGNMDFVDEDEPSGFVAVLGRSETSRHALEKLCFLLGFAFDPDEPDNAFVHLFTKKRIKQGSEVIIKGIEAKHARDACDAVAKALFARLFNYIVDQINVSIIERGTEDDIAIIGVLDIFGFESFARNDFEQLLINYTNESLQATFNEQIFQSEAALYKREQLVLESGDAMKLPEGNSECMDLLEGGSSKSPGVLLMIDQQGKLPQPKDSKLNDALHKSHAKSKAFGKVHPRDLDRNFIIIHYAGPVKYTVGSFLSKNADQLPKEVDEFFTGSTSPVVPVIWGSTGFKSIKEAGAKSVKSSRKGTSIVTKFRAQIIELKDYLDSTRCSFIRCVKPNPFLTRDDSNNEWFNRRYVTSQLKALSILQTAEVLKNGFPTRIAYEELTDTYSTILPDTALNSWRGLGGGSVSAFIAALFWAFEIPSDAYKLGLTKVFFKSGKLTELDGILNAATRWRNGEDQQQQDSICARFQHFFLRRRWRVVFAKMVACARFLSFLSGTQDRGSAATKIAQWWLRTHFHNTFKAKWKAAIVFQKYTRGWKKRMEYETLSAEYRKKLEREERELQERIAREERERQEAIEKARIAREKREQAEREERERKKRLEKEKKEQEKWDKEIAKSEELLKRFKKNKTKMQAKLEKQLRHLESMSVWEEGESEQAEEEQDVDEDDAGVQNADDVVDPREQAVKQQTQTYMKDINRARRHQDALAQRLAELEDAQEEFSEAQKLKEEEEQAVEEAKERDVRLKELRTKVDETRAARTRANKTLEMKKLRQRKELEDAVNSFFGLEGYRARAKSERKSQNMVKGLRFQLAYNDRKMKRHKQVRPSYMPPEGARAFYDPEEDDDTDDSGEYVYGAGGATLMTREETPQRLEARGYKAVKKGFFGGSKGWQPKKMAVDLLELTVILHTLNGTSVSTKKKPEVFHLNNKTFQFPTVIFLKPEEFKEKPYVMKFVGGFLPEHHNTTRHSLRKRELVIAFENENDFESWIDALSEYIDEDDLEASRLDPKAGHPMPKKSIVSVSDAKGRTVQKMENLIDPEEGQKYLEEHKEADPKKWVARMNLLEKSGYSEDETTRMLLSYEDEENPAEDDGTVMIKCKNCHKMQAVRFDASSCPSCDADLYPGDDDDNAEDDGVAFSEDMEDGPDI